MNATSGEPPDLSRLSCLHDYERAAQARLSAEVWAYLNAGAADGLTHKWNTQAYQRRAVLPRVLQPATGGNTAVRLLGTILPHPILIAPTAYHALAHPQAERATALAAAALHAPYVVSTLSSVSLEDIAQTHRQASQEQTCQGGTASPLAPPAPLWFQLYLQPERDISLDLLRRAEAAGYQAIMLTVDAPIQGLRNQEQRLGFQHPARIAAANLTRYTAPAAQGSSLPAGASLFSHPLVIRMASWTDVAWLVAHSRLPVLIKGILHPLDVAPALNAGAAGLIVSNHGGRVLDTVPATLDALPAIMAALPANRRDSLPVLIDGGIRRGTDVLKARALGATAVLIGRPVLHGLAVAGATGVAHVLNLLRSELEAAMVLAGCKTWDAITSALLMPDPEETR